MSAASSIRVRNRTTGAPGKEIILGRSDEHSPRHSEGDLVQLADGSMLAVWSRFSGAGDHDRSEIVGRRSADGGLSWGEIESIASLSEPEHQRNSNLMSASLLRLPGTDKVLLVYLAKESFADPNKQVCYPFCRFTTDGRSFTKPVPMADRDHYYVINNARLIQLPSGRILAPCAVALDPDKGVLENAACLAFISDDGGASWRRGQPRWINHEKYRTAVPKAGWLTLQEPGVLELKDGRVLMVIRTGLGHPCIAFSDDRGETWSDPRPVEELNAPWSPQTLLRLPQSGRIAMIYNDQPKGGHATWSERRPLSFAVSSDEGATWQSRKHIEVVEGRCWSYVAARVVGESVYLLCYEWPQGWPGFYFCDFKLSIIPLSWFEET